MHWLIIASSDRTMNASGLGAGIGIATQLNPDPDFLAFRIHPSNWLSFPNNNITR